MDTLTLTAANGRDFTARVLRPGDKYGKDGIYGPCEIGADEKPQVEFFDLTHKFTPFAVSESGVERKGQFTGGRYFIETILGEDRWGSGTGGVNLQGGEPAWTIDAATMDAFRAWLRAVLVLDAIKEQHKGYLVPLTMDDGSVLSPAYPPPVLMPNDMSEGGWMIVWEEGPDEWPFVLEGGTTEEERVLFAQASEEFGTTMTAPTRPAAKMPAGVFVEPINHYSVGVYPA